MKFATVLLRDRHGVIDLDVPVAGTLDDPTFRIGPIIWKIIKNLIVKAVTAPFALLGALFSGAEDAQHVDFVAGSAALDPAIAGRLGALSKSLVEKPGLNVGVPIGALPELDGPALLELAYQSALAATVATTLPPPRTEGGARPPFAGLSPQNKLTVLTALVKKQTGTATEIPEPPAPPGGTSRDDAQAMQQAAAIQYLEQEARSHVSVPESEYGRLAEERAAAVQHALLAGSRTRARRACSWCATARSCRWTARSGSTWSSSSGLASRALRPPGEAQVQPGDPTSHRANASHGPVPEPRG